MAKLPHASAEMRALYLVFRRRELAAGGRYTTTSAPSRGGCLGDEESAAVAGRPRRAGPRTQSLSAGARPGNSIRSLAGCVGLWLGGSVDTPAGRLGAPDWACRHLGGRVAQALARQ